jgi:hypothetical protein
MKSKRKIKKSLLDRRRLFSYMMTGLEVPSYCDDDDISIVTSWCLCIWLGNDTKVTIIHSSKWLRFVRCIESMISAIIIYLDIEGGTLAKSWSGRVRSIYRRDKSVAICCTISRKRVDDYRSTRIIRHTSICRSSCDRCTIESIGTDLDTHSTCRYRCTREIPESDRARS